MDLPWAEGSNTAEAAKVTQAEEWGPRANQHQTTGVSVYSACACERGSCFPDGWL